MQRLVDGAQKLREAIQQLARQQSGEARDKAIDAAQEALVSTQRAMLTLPPALRVEDVKIREAKDWPKAMARLDSAASALQDAVVAITKQAPGNERDRSVAAVNKALSETQQAMLAIPGYDAKN